jgi:hypothetical protein
MNRIDAMHIFVRVAEMASFTRAADSLGLPKASASMAVQQSWKGSWGLSCCAGPRATCR